MHVVGNLHSKAKLNSECSRPSTGEHESANRAGHVVRHARLRSLKSLPAVAGNLLWQQLTPVSVKIHNRAGKLV